MILICIAIALALASGVFKLVSNTKNKDGCHRWWAADWSLGCLIVAIVISAVLSIGALCIYSEYNLIDKQFTMTQEYIDKARLNNVSNIENTNITVYIAEKNSDLMRMKYYAKSKWIGVIFPASVDSAQYLK